MGESYLTSVLVQVNFKFPFICTLNIGFLNTHVDFKCAGASVIACARSNRHLIAFEADEEIFDGVLATFKRPDPLEEESGESAYGDDYDSDEPYLKKPRTYIGV